MRISEKQLEGLVKDLNDINGFKGRTLRYNKTKKKNIPVGSGYGLNYAYGGVQLVWERKGTTGEKNITERMSKSQLYNTIDNMIKAIKYYKERAKLK